MILDMQVIADCGLVFEKLAARDMQPQLLFGCKYVHNVPV